MTAWTALLDLSRGVFTAPSFALFADLRTGWVLTQGRRTSTAMITVADPGGRRAHDGYHRFVRDGAWSMSTLWRLLAIHAVDRFAPAGAIELLRDDTLHHKSGRQVAGAGIFRDAVRSTVKKVVYALDLNLVVACLRVQPGWAGTPVAIPVNMRSHRKKDSTTTVAHAVAMLTEIAAWFGARDLHLTAEAPTPPSPARCPPACT